MQLELLHKNFVWSSVAEAFSGSVVKAMHGHFYVLFGNQIERHFFWKELANQSVHIFVGTALPR